VERALGALAADYRRPTGPVVTAAILVITAMLMYQPAPGVLFSGTLLAIAATAPVAVIRRFPAAAIGVLLSVGALYVFFGRLSWPPAAMAGWVIGLAACPVMLSKKAAIRAFLATEVVVLLAAQRFAPSDTPWDATAAEALAVVAAWGAGELIRSRRQSAATQAAAAEQVKLLSERDVVARERASIARELHDVVAHHVSMIAVRAGTAPYAIKDLPEPGQEAFAEIAREARTALTELRVVLGVLRDPARATEAAPQPRLGDVEALLERVRGTGADLTWAVTGTARSLPGSVELCGYRIVQEAVTNAGRHAPRGRVEVSIGYAESALHVVISNTAGRDGAGGAAGAGGAGEAAGAGGGRGRAEESPAGTGFGLVGLRERVAMLGGQISAGPTEDGGFEVAAVLPAAAAGPPAGDEGAAEDAAADVGAADAAAAAEAAA
jgi:signal transduction histidine kinase